MYKYNQISEYLHNKAMKARIPLNGTFELTPVCNMDCKMCYVRKSLEEQQAIAPLRSASEWIELARKVKDAGMLFLLLTGGEPFLRADFISILSAINHMGIVTTVNTNGTLINEHMIEDLVKAGPTKLNITLYGASDDTYARLCNNPRGFTQVTHAIELLRARNIDLKINMSITPYNVDDLDAMYAWCHDHKLNVQASAYMFPSVRKDDANTGHNDRFSPEEAAFATARIDCLGVGEERFIRYFEEKGALPNPPDDNCMIPGEGTGIRCRAGGCTFWVTWEGKILPCGIMPVGDAPNVFELGFDESWEQVKSFTDSIRLPAKCNICELKESCRSCAAMSICETGQFDQVPEYRCKMYQSYGKAVEKLITNLKERKNEN